MTKRVVVMAPLSAKNDGCYKTDAVVSAKAVRVTSESECRRLFQSLWKLERRIPGQGMVTARESVTSGNVCCCCMAPVEW